MREFNDFMEIANYFNICSYDVEKKYYEQAWRGSFFVKDTEIIPCVDNGLIKYVVIDKNDTVDYNKYLMKYEVNNYDWKVYVDDLEGWQNCKVLSIDNNELEITRATVKTDYGTVVDRIVEYAETIDDIQPNRCVFMIEKEFVGYEANKFYTTKNTILLAENYRGGYFFNPRTNRVENIVHKDSGYANCIIGDLDYMRSLVKYELKNSSAKYTFTEEGKKILNLE